MAVYVTGDIHGNSTRLSKDSFYEQKNFSGNKDENIKYDVSSFEELIANARNKAIDDFVKTLQEKIEKDLANPDLALECKKCGIWKNYDIKEIAEQLKAGVTND